MRPNVARLALVLALVAACARVEKVEVSLAQPLLTSAGQQSQVAAKALDADGKALDGKEFTYESSDPAVATIDEKGVVSAVRSGSATLKATTAEKSGTVSVDVRIPAELKLAGPITIEGVGGSTAIDAVVNDDAGRPIAGAAVNFELADPAFASFAGKSITGLAIGATKLTASFGALRAETDVTVVQPTIATQEFGPKDRTIKVGEKLPIEYQAKSAAGSLVVGVLPEFSSSNEKVATIAGGLITAVGAGKATITAKVGEQVATITVTVTK